ncbi:hypothetical protein [Streptomyces iconiensis]|uniref:Uncharacterized protein n=1 Tax=Streptomyces iconiensis TaxID=1384038 RepID=A0ABT7A4H9_9ACTN|nr:hypothetical protein [Streptomyces iconiensis]MDJ1136252.1 hypothetical protein [Streptomyces iconiensis]
MSQAAMSLVGTPLSVSFYDSYVPQIPPGEYTVRTTHTLDGKQLDPTDQTFTIAAPRFLVGQDLVEAVYPAQGALGDYQLVAPHITLNRELLPWSRPLTVSGSELGEPWMTLLLLREEEILRSAPATAKEALQATSEVAVPALGDIGAEAQTISCQTIEISVETFDRVAPRRPELPYLVHAREVDEKLPHHLGLFREDGERMRTGKFAVAFTSRLPRLSGRYQAHLVSLEGCESYFQSAGRPARLRLFSLYSWSFEQVTGGRSGFTARMRHLAAPAAPKGEHAAALGLRLAPTSPTPPGDLGRHVTDRLGWGYTPISYHTLGAEDTFAWYRGPFVPAPALKAPWADATGTLRHLERPDSALIYLKRYGIYDLSYAAAWTLGRLLALSTGDVSAPLLRARNAAWRALHLSAADATSPFTRCGPSAQDHSEAEPLSGLELVDHLMATHLPDLLAGLPTPPGDADRPAPEPVVAAAPCHEHDERPCAPRPALSAAVQQAAADPGIRRRIRRAIAPHVHVPAPTGAPDTAPEAPGAGAAQDVYRDAPFLSAAHLDAWTLLCAVPFHYLVPDARALPEESLRFFYLDPAWLQALVDGAVSVGVATTLDSVITAELREAVAATTDVLPCGMLLRTQLTLDIPNLLITATRKGETVTTFRRKMGSGVWLLLFADVPDKIVFAEPYHGLHFGLDESNEGAAATCQINLRALKDGNAGHRVGTNLGRQLKDVQRFLRPVPDGTPDVLCLLSAKDSPKAPTRGEEPAAGGLVAALAQALADAGQFDIAQRRLLSPAEFALQCVDGPQTMTFSYPR